MDQLAHTLARARAFAHDGDYTDEEREQLAILLAHFPDAAAGPFETFEAPMNMRLLPLAVATSDEERPRAIDVNTRARRVGEHKRPPMVVDGLLPERAILVVVAEEGQGKTLLADQVCRQLHRGEPILGLWTPGERRPERTVFVDTHQEDPEVDDRCAEMNRRLPVDDGRILWATAGGLDVVRSDDDRRYLVDLIAGTDADFLWIDAGSHLVPDPREDPDVRALFDFLSAIAREYSLSGIGLTLFPRKRGRGDFFGRQFDDLLGSREWKARPSQVLYFEDDRIMSWKDRPRAPGGPTRSWPTRTKGRYPWARLRRPGLTDDTVPPFLIEIPEPAEDRADGLDDAIVEARALDLVAEQPARFSKTSLAKALGVQKRQGLAVVGGLIEAGRIGPDAARAKLSLIHHAGDAQPSS